CHVETTASGERYYQRDRFGGELGGNSLRAGQSDKGGEEAGHHALGESAACGSWVLHSVVSYGSCAQHVSARWPLAGDSDAGHITVLARVVGDGAMHGAAVVPHQDLIVAPTCTTGEVESRAVFVQERQNRRA